MKGGLKSPDKIVKLDPDDMEVFEAFKLWLYTGKLVSNKNKLDGAKLQVLWVNTWIFADYLGIPGLKNCVTDAIIDSRCWCTFVVPKVYRETSEGSPLRRLFVGLTRLAGSL